MAQNGIYTYSRVHPYGPNTRIKALVCNDALCMLAEGTDTPVSPERLIEAQPLVLAEIADRVAYGTYEYTELDLNWLDMLLPPVADDSADLLVMDGVA